MGNNDNNSWYNYDTKWNQEEDSRRFNSNWDSNNWRSSNWNNTTRDSNADSRTQQQQQYPDWDSWSEWNDTNYWGENSWAPSTTCSGESSIGSSSSSKKRKRTSGSETKSSGKSTAEFP